MLRKVTKELIEDITAYHRVRTRQPFAQAALWAEQDDEQADAYEQMIDDRELLAQERRELITKKGMRAGRSNSQAPLETAEALVASLGLDAPAGSPQLSLISMAVRDGTLAGERDIDRIIAGERPQLEAPPALYAGSSSAGPTIRDAVQRYLTDKAVRPKTAHEVETSLTLFETIVGNKELAHLTRRDFTTFIEGLAKKQVGGRSAESVVRMIGPGTVKKRLGFLRTAINHAIERHLHEGGNPASGINVGAWVRSPDLSVMPIKRPFTDTELNLVFQHPWFTGCHSPKRSHEPGTVRLTGAHYWAPVVALFTGCRASELGGLKLNEIDLESASPHIRIRDNEYRPTKGGYPRSVPILDALLELGFDRYVEEMRSRGEDRLFPDWQSPRRTGDFHKDNAAWSNAGIIRAFNRTVIKRQLAQTLSASARREVTFHSFRGAFKSLLLGQRPAIQYDAINEIIGHAKVGEDKRYRGQVPLEETYRAVHACRWPNLVVPTLS
jgi:integrase